MHITSSFSTELRAVRRQRFAWLVASHALVGACSFLSALALIAHALSLQ